MSHVQPIKPPRYSSTYEDGTYQYRHVILDKSTLTTIPKTRLMNEYEWRALGIQQGPHWEHYLIHKPEPFVLMFRRLLKYRAELNPAMQQQNTHFPTTRMPTSSTLNLSISHPLGDSTNMKKNMIINGGSRLAINHYKTMHDAMDESNDDLRESDFASHDYDG
ncbi:unnamed protein product [Rotaria socialis]|uniref:Cyclin-dependent kinases regulatory subunit n=1 Tax=Rotaria socialis TaxID=392032 RepID=A0A817TTD4_9BILA|nr:unnamed protein product [Rotaria socialis]CAF3326968.1 unnamed protein product [Rotaria socialis]CAF3356698.1 unnamed protein product [Rotaria socialis]CAF3578546.1 unnamed protein product [Rotaria socialis]CAF4300948.1 unnamed protein product [Rotaria socialis]